jgi:hypothetical protein
VEDDRESEEGRQDLPTLLPLVFRILRSTRRVFHRVRPRETSHLCPIYQAYLTMGHNSSLNRSNYIFRQTMQNRQVRVLCKGVGEW